MADIEYLGPLEDNKIEYIGPLEEKPKSFLDRVSAWAGETYGDTVPGIEMGGGAEPIPNAPSFSEVGKSILDTAALPIMMPVGWAASTLSGIAAKSFTNDPEFAEQIKEDVGRRTGWEPKSEAWKTIMGAVEPGFADVSKVAREMSGSARLIPGVNPDPSEPLFSGKLYQNSPVEDILTFGLEGAAFHKGGKIAGEGKAVAKAGLRNAVDATRIPDMNVLKPAEQPTLRPVPIPEAPVEYIGPLEPKDPAYTQGESYAQNFVKKNKISDLDKVITTLQEKVKGNGNQYYQGILDTLEKEKVAKAPQAEAPEYIGPLETPIETKTQKFKRIAAEKKGKVVEEPPVEEVNAPIEEPVPEQSTVAPEAVSNQMESPVEAKTEGMNEPVYHGGAGVDALNKKFSILTPEEKRTMPSSNVGLTGLSMTLDKGAALEYSRNIGGTDKVFETKTNPEAKIYKIDTKGDGIDDFFTDDQINDIKSKGFDAILDTSTSGEKEFRALTDKAVTNPQTHFGPTSAPEGESLFAIKSGDRTFVSDTPKSDANHGTLYGKYSEIIDNYNNGVEPVTGWIDDKGKFVTNGEAKAPIQMTPDTLKERYPTVPDEFFSNVDSATISSQSMPRQRGRDISARDDATLLHEAGHMREDLLASTPELETQWKAIHEKELNKGPWGDRPGNKGGSPEWMWEDLLEIFGIYHKKASGHKLSAKELSALERNPEAVKYVSTNLSKPPLKDTTLPADQARPTSKQASTNAQKAAKEREAKAFQEVQDKFAEEAASTESISEREARRKAESLPVKEVGKYPWDNDDTIYPPGTQKTSTGYEVMPSAKKYPNEVRNEWAKERIAALKGQLGTLSKTAATSKTGIYWDTANERKIKTSNMKGIRGEISAWEEEIKRTEPKSLPKEKSPLRYTPETNRHNGDKLVRGDILTDKEGNRYALDRDSGFILTVAELNAEGKPTGLKSFSVDPMDKTRYADLYKTGDSLYEKPLPKEDTAKPDRATEIRDELVKLQAQYEKKMKGNARSAMVPPSIKSDVLSSITKKMDKLDAELAAIEKPLPEGKVETRPARTDQIGSSTPKVIEPTPKIDENVVSFTASLNPMQTGKVTATLNKQVRYDGEVRTVKEQVEKMVSEGRVAKIKKSIDEKALSDAKAERSRIYSSGDQNIQAKRIVELDAIIENPPQKESYRIVAPDGSLYEVGKTAYDYAKHLESKGKVDTVSTQMESAFIKSSKGSIDHGYITDDIAKQIKREAAPIRVTNEDLSHITSERLKQIKDAGYADANTLMEDVAANYTNIYQGKGKSLILKKKNGASKAAYIELEPNVGDSFYRIKSALIAREDYFNSKKMLWEEAQSLHSPEGTPSAISGRSNTNLRPSEPNVNSKVIIPSKTEVKNVTSHYETPVEEIALSKFYSERIIKGPVTPKEQKKYVLDRLDNELIPATRKAWREENGVGKDSELMDDKNLDSRLSGKGTFATNTPQGDVTINVPGTKGTFKVSNDLQALLNLRKNINAMSMSDKDVTKPSFPSKKPKGLDTEQITKAAQEEVNNYNDTRENTKSNYLSASTEEIKRANDKYENLHKIQDEVVAGTRTLKSLEGLEMDEGNWKSRPFQGKVPSSNELSRVVREAGDSLNNAEKHAADLKQSIIRNYPEMGREMFPKDNVQNILFSGLDPTQIIPTLKSLTGDIKAAMPHLENLGRHFYESGKRTFNEWFDSMKSSLGDLWGSFKGQMLDIWSRMKQIEFAPSGKKLGDERGSFQVGKHDPDLYEAALDLGKDHIKESKSFEDFSKRMFDEVGEDIKPYLKDIFGELKVEAPKVEKPVPAKETPKPEPSILEGDEKVRGLAQSIEDKAIEKGLIKDQGDLGELPTYAVRNMAEPARRVRELLDSDYDRALRIIEGKESAPEGLFPEEVFTGVRIRAELRGDVETLKMLLDSPQIEAATTLGRRIKALDSGFDETSPFSVMKDVTKTRQEAAKKQGKKVATKEEVDKLTAELDAKSKALDEALAREETKKQDAAIDELIKTKTSKPKAAPIKYGSHNKIFTTEKYEKAKTELRAQLSGTQLNALIDPTILAKYVDIGGYHLEAGVRSFSSWSAKMVSDLGRGVEPHLNDIWKATHDVFGKAAVDSVKGKITKAIEKSEGRPNIRKYVDDLAEHFITKGLKDREAVISAVHNVLKDVIPDITRRETRDALSGYGEWKKLTHNEILDRKREIKGESQQVSKLEDLQDKLKKFTADKTGRERQGKNDEWRRLEKQVNEAKKVAEGLKKKYGIETVDKETHLKSTMDAIHTRLTNQIADLESQITSKKKIVAEKSSITYDAEANRLKGIRDGLKKKYDEIFADPKKTPSEKYDLAQKQRLNKQIEVLEKQIQTREKVVKDRMQTAIDRETYDLTQKRNALRDASEKIFGKKEMTPQQRIDAAIKAVERAEAEYKRKVTLKDLSPMGKKTSPLQSAELSKARENRDFWKAKLQELRDIANPKKTPEQIANQSLRTRLLNETKKLEEKINNLDFAKAEKKVTVLDPETQKIKEERNRVKEILKVATEGTVTKEEAVNIVKLSKDTADLKTVWEGKLKEHDADLNEFMRTNPKARFDYGAAKRAFENYAFELKGENAPIKTKLKNRWDEAKTTWADNRAAAVGDVIKDSLKSISENSVALVGALDDSFIGRQGWFTLATHPTAWWSGAKKSVTDFAKTMGGKNTIDALMADVYSQPRYLNGEYQKAGLISLTEETYPTSLPGRIPIVGRAFKASEAAFLGSALRMRLGVYDILADMQKRNGVDMMVGEQAPAVGTLVNSLTYRGKWGKTGVTPWVRLVLWAPNIIKGQWDILTAHTLGAGLPTAFARNQARINSLKILGEIATIQLIANAISPGSAETDPRASGWGTIKVGNQRFDYTAGLRQEIIFMARLRGKSINSNTGKVTNLYEPGYGKHTAWDMVTNLIGNKFTPAAGVVRDKLRAEFFGGIPFTWPGALWRLQAPISIQQTAQLKDDTSPEQVAGVITDIFGMNSMNTEFDKTQKTPYDELFNAVFEEEEDTSRTRGLRNTRSRARTR